MNRKSITVGICCLLAVLLVTVQVRAAALYDVYKWSQVGEPPDAVPDVNKNPATPPPDNTCWLGVAANMLAGAGWGLSGATAQQNADAIYGQLTAHFGTLQPGWEERAINWWLLNYGYNPNAPDIQYYAPTRTYNDVTHVERTLTAADYDFLLDELARCQYVGVSFMDPANVEVGHAMTLVGGNYSMLRQPPPNVPPQVAVWHDTDDGLVGDNAMTNRWGPGNNWYVDYWKTPENPNDDFLAENYTTLCPGLQKPREAIENYDVAFYKDMEPATGMWFNTFRVAGKQPFAVPHWESDYLTLHVYNEENPDLQKKIYLLVDYLDRDNGIDPGVLLITEEDFNGIAPTHVTFSADLGQILFEWDLTYQPEEEWIRFPSIWYHDLAGDVKDFNIATICVPEPATMALLALGGIALLRRRK